MSHRGVPPTTTFEGLKVWKRDLPHAARNSEILCPIFMEFALHSKIGVVGSKSSILYGKEGRLGFRIGEAGLVSGHSYCMCQITFKNPKIQIRIE